MSSPKHRKIKSWYGVFLASRISDVIWRFYVSIYFISRTLQRIESNQPIFYNLGTLYNISLVLVLLCFNKGINLEAACMTCQSFHCQPFPPPLPSPPPTLHHSCQPPLFPPPPLVFRISYKLCSLLYSLWINKIFKHFKVSFCSYFYSVSAFINLLRFRLYKFTVSAFTNLLRFRLYKFTPFPPLSIYSVYAFINLFCFRLYKFTSFSSL